jgi:hypothetical protein
MALRMTDLGVTVLGLVLAAHAVLSLTKRRWVTCLLEVIVTIVLFWQQWQLRQRPEPVGATGP